ncbi:MAG: DUF86 domain-containing protein [Candidatus Nealsonbacteria bacterium DGGOD1a]|jgi:Uncharacterized conserved protein|nr:MAG: DUF86 domain-containing protein [Candidatus Nealsonbacteria bacterium DGGOD1a]
MVDINTVIRKISAVKKYIKLLGNYEKYSIEEIKSDVFLRGSAERYLYLACQAALDLGEAVISFKDFRKPGTYSEIFYILGEEKVIPQKLEKKLVEMAKFRNVVAHDYENLDFGIIYKAIIEDINDLSEFANIVEKYFNL